MPICQAALICKKKRILVLKIFKNGIKKKIPKIWGFLRSLGLLVCFALKPTHLQPKL